MCLSLITAVGMLYELDSTPEIRFTVSLWQIWNIDTSWTARSYGVTGMFYCLWHTMLHASLCFLNIRGKCVSRRYAMQCVLFTICRLQPLQLIFLPVRPSQKFHYRSAQPVTKWPISVDATLNTKQTGHVIPLELDSMHQLYNQWC